MGSETLRTKPKISKKTVGIKKNGSEHEYPREILTITTRKSTQSKNRCGILIVQY